MSDLVMNTWRVSVGKVIKNRVEARLGSRQQLASMQARFPADCVAPLCLSSYQRIYDVRHIIYILQKEDFMAVEYSVSHTVVTAF